MSMDAEWELIERTKSINAMAPAPAPVPQQPLLAELESAKREGNALFQRKQLPDAVRTYSLVVDRCVAALASANLATHSTDEHRAVRAIEVAVRLNRALANIEQREFAAVERDCSTVLDQQPECVKALYRRALARECLGKIQDARDDLCAMLALEPANPAALELRARIDAKTATCSANNAPDDARVLVDEMRHCSLAKTSRTADATRPSRLELGAAAEQAWRVLQDEEMQMRQAIKAKAKLPPRSANSQLQSVKTAVVTPVRKSMSMSNNQEHDTVTSKTNDLWASLAQEEQRTVARVYQKRRQPRRESAQ